MNGPEHYQAAEIMLNNAEEALYSEKYERAHGLYAAAMAHAQLAAVAIAYDVTGGQEALNGEQWHVATSRSQG